MRTKGCLLLALFLALPAGPAMAARTSFGANWGLTIHHIQGGDNTTIIGIPAEVSSFQPGIRIGVSDEKMRNELYFDTGFSLLSGGGSLHTIEVTANYQYTFPSEKLSSPYLTVGAGAISEGVDVGFGSVSAVSAVFGAGVGVRTRLQNDHGAFRVEARVDRITEGKDGVNVLIDKATLYGIKAGFDLWLK